MKKSRNFCPGFRIVSLLILLFASGLPVLAQDLSLTNSGLFFEEPRVVIPQGAVFPDAQAGGGLMTVTYQEIVKTGDQQGNIYLSLLISTDGKTWTQHNRVVGPVPYSRETPPQMFSTRITEQGDIYLTYSDTGRITRVLRSTDQGGSFQELAALQTNVTSVAPRIFVRADGGLLLFANQNIGMTQSILYAYSDNGVAWSEFRPLETDTNIGFNFLPYHVSINGRDVVVFQALNATRAPTYQLYFKSSTDGGRTWGTARLLTDFVSDSDVTNPLDYDNQRVYLRVISGQVVMVWERRLARNDAQIFLAYLRSDGSLAGEPERVTDSEGGAGFPQVFETGGRTFVLWFSDPLRSSQIMVSTQVSSFWRSAPVSGRSGDSTFGTAVLFRSRVHMFWQNRTAGETRLVYLEPDQSAAPPRVIPTNFVAGRRSPNNVAELRWTPPADPSGISGYGYVWSQNSDAPVPRQIDAEGATGSAEFPTSRDGAWYFRISTRDRAGNWSTPVTVEFFRDTTPPPPVTFVQPKQDQDGYLPSNSFTLQWNAPDVPDLAGYTLSLNRVGEPSAQIPVSQGSLQTLPSGIVTTSTSISRTNLDNGLWQITVAPVDGVGNVGPPQTLRFRLDNYIPVTQVFRIDTSRDILGRYSLAISGRGFTANGRIEEVIIDRDARQPYDYVFRLSNGEFRLVDNRRIAGLTIDQIETGNYRIGLLHSSRGISFAAQRLAFEASGTITFGDYTVRYAPDYSLLRTPPVIFGADDLVMWLVLLLVSLLAVFAATRVGTVVKEGRLLQLEARALVTGAPLPGAIKRKRIEEMRRRGIGLRVKFTFFVVVLVVAVVVAVAFFVGRTALQRQESILARGLEQRIQVLLDSVTTQAESLLQNPSNNRIELATLTDQASVLQEATYVTITGQGQGSDQHGFVWATNDPALTGGAAASGRDSITRQLDTPSLVEGQSQLQDAVAREEQGLRDELNQKARAALGDLPAQINQVNQQLTQLILQGGASANDPRIAELDRTRRELQGRLVKTLTDIGKIYRSIPTYDPTALSREQTSYVFYQPALSWQAGQQGASAQYYRGMVRVGISTDLILQQIDNARDDLIVSTALVALGAVIAGIAGALLLATIVVIPINRLVRGVELIRDTEDKAQLEGHEISVGTRDELSVLADTVNSMTQGLVRAAAASKDLTVGKEVQKMFIPLRTDARGRKLTTAWEDTPGAEFAGYYEGAKGVSGDYFTYQRLDGDHYALIKCDVSGKGVPAALIMVEVATIFTNFFKDWQGRGAESGVLGRLVTQINDLLESMAFKGRFAALTVGIMDVTRGRMRLCNAGDNQLHVFDTEKGEVVQSTMPEAPAAGVFPSMMIPNGFPEIAVGLKTNDITLLFTDGVEEAKRILRDSQFRPHSVTAEDMEAGLVPSFFQEGVEDEEFGIPRIHDVVKAVEQRGTYRLSKIRNPLGDEELEFNFSSVEPTAENVVMALVAAEKIFRMYPDPKAGPDDRIEIDKRVDDFLKSAFVQYRKYFHHPLEEVEESEYRYYSHMREDEQYDDLTILAIRKK